MGIFDKMFGSSGNITDVSDQTLEEQKLVSWVKNKVEEVRQNSSRITHEGVWLTNTAYLLGFDGVYYDTFTRTFRGARIGNNALKKSRINVNKILPTINNRQARLCKNPPRWEIRPNSADAKDKEAARLSYQVSQNIYEMQKVNEKRLDLYMWLQQCGHAYIKTSWDPSLGKLMVDPMTMEYTFEGDVRVDVVSAFEVFVDPLAQSLDDAQWLIHAKVRKLDYFKERYPDKGQLVKEEGVWLLSLQNEQRIQTISTHGRGDQINNDIQKNSAIELVYYEKRSKKHPFGRQVSVANGVLLEDKELPIGEIPFAKFDDIKVGGKFYSESVITHLRPIQDQYSKTVTLRAAWTNRMLMGKYLAAKGHGLIADSPNDQSGEIVEFDPVPNAPPPQALQVPSIPAYAYKETDELQKDIFDISGVNEISRAIMPAAGIPAKGMEFLQEQDDTRIGVITEQHEHAWAKSITHMLMFAQKFYKTPRLLKLVGKDMEYTFKNFVGADMRNSTDVLVKRGSTIPTSKYLNQQQIFNTYQQGLLGDPADPAVREKVFSLLEFGQGQEIWKDVALVEAQINRDIEQIQKGEVPPVSEFDNHTRHLQLKNEFRLTEAFDQMPFRNQQILLDNMEIHLKYVVKQSAPEMDAQHQVAKTEGSLAIQEMDDLSKLGHIPPEWSEEVPPEEQ